MTLLLLQLSYLINFVEVVLHRVLIRLVKIISPMEPFKVLITPFFHRKKEIHDVESNRWFNG